MRFILAIAFALFAGLAHAADYTVTEGAPLKESVRYGFDDTVTFVSQVDGVYNVDVVPTTMYLGCAVRYCRTRSSIVTTFTNATIGSVNLLPAGNASIPMQAGTSYVLHLSGVGTGTGSYAGFGAYAVSVAKVQ